MPVFQPSDGSTLSSDPVGLVNTVFSHSEDIRKVIRSFDFQKELVAGRRPLQVDLAPSWRPPTEIRERMDERCFIMISGTMHSLSELSADARKWDAIQSAMMQNPLLNPEANTASQRASLRIPKSTGRLCIPTPSVKDKPESWFDTLVGSPDVVTATAIDIDTIIHAASQLGSQIPSRLFRTVNCELPLVDITVLRFPDVNNPFFELYNLILYAWYQRRPILVPAKGNVDGLTGVFKSCKFRPRDAIIDGLSSQVRESAVREAEALFTTKTQRVAG